MLTTFEFNFPSLYYINEHLSTITDKYTHTPVIYVVILPREPLVDRMFNRIYLRYQGRTSIVAYN